MTLPRIFTGLAALMLLAVASTLLLRADDATKAGADAPQVFELRTYTTVPGRLPALNARFRDHTVKLFEKHGMKNIAYWTPVDKPDTLVYVISHKSREAAEKSWKAFLDDPEWNKARTESEKDGKIVEKVERQYLTPTDYSPMK